MTYGWYWTRTTNYGLHQPDEHIYYYRMRGCRIKHIVSVLYNVCDKNAFLFSEPTN